MDLSDHARLLGQLRRLSEPRLDRIDRIRDEIAEGAYPTEEQIDLAVDRLLKAMRTDTRSRPSDD